jgi:hypothetical protein
MSEKVQARDRPYARIVRIKEEDVERMREIIADIPRKRVWRSVSHKSDGTSAFYVYMRQCELLLVSLSVCVLSIEKPKLKKKPDRYGWKTTVI